jgi:succinate dehydrogenase / fumarate reductase flavoprotein subunit
MYRQFLETEMLDISRQPMEVAPTAHYSMGGVVVEPETQATAVEGLYAVGEVTSGLHGANRLGGNSLAETVVFGKRVGEAAAAYSQSRETQVRSRTTVAAAHDDLNALLSTGDELARPLQRALRDAMWECCGVVRSEERLRQGLEEVTEVKDAAARVDVRPSAEGYQDLAQALDLRSSLLAAEVTIRGAIERRESRGAHQRSDYPHLDPALQVTLVAMQTAGTPLFSRRAVPEVPDYLQKWVNETRTTPMKGGLLE